MAVAKKAAKAPAKTKKTLLVVESPSKAKIISKYLGYHYLQYTTFGKKRSEYLRETEVESVCEKLSRREFLSEELAENNANLVRLEKAAKILDDQLSRTFFFLRQCADMDALPISKRDKALSFARAMTSLEGLPAKQTTEENLQLWAKGEKNFADIYLPALQDYHVMEASR